MFIVTSLKLHILYFKNLSFSRVLAFILAHLSLNVLPHVKKILSLEVLVAGIDNILLVTDAILGIRYLLSFQKVSTSADGSMSR